MEKVTELLFMLGYSADEGSQIVQEFIDIFSAEKIENFVECFEGSYHSFEQFAKEHYDDCNNDEEEDFESYKTSLEEFYVFLPQSKTIFRDI
jgi:hypothetical protein